MLIKKITIQNFLCYYGTDNEFLFTEGLNMVLGANGYGKSKLYDAFQWVFGDGITDNATTATLSKLRPTSVVKGELVSEKAKEQCAVGESVEAKVCIEVEAVRNNAPKAYQLIRTYTIRRTSTKQWVEPAKSEFQLFEYDIISFKPIPPSRYEEVLEWLIPVDVRPYVWFQGERGINNLIDTSNTTSLRNVIKKLSDIDRWDRYIQATQKAYETAKNAFDLELKKSQKGQEEIEKLQTEYRLLEREIAQLEGQITSALQNEQFAKEKKDGLLASIEFAQKINEYTQTRDQARRAYENAVKEADTFNETLGRKLFTDNWVLLDTTFLLRKFEEKHEAYDVAVATRKAIANLDKKLGEKLQIRLPDNVPEPMYVRQMLADEHCKVCDRPAPEGSDAYEAIRSLLLPEPEISQPELPRTNLKSFFKQLMQNGLGMASSIESINYRVQQSMHDGQMKQEQVGATKLELEARMRELQEQEQTSGITNARDIMNSMDGAIADITKFGRDLDKYRTQKEQKENRQKQINDRLNVLSQGQVPPYLIQKKEMLFDVAELAKRVKDTKYRELVRQLEDAANEHYRNINAPTGAFYGTIRFVETGTDGGYRPAILNADGREVSNLNTSLVSSLKLSIIMAIVSANKTRNYASFYPLISDAPVSDFDVVKAMTFFNETANTFTQSIVIVKELLLEDPDRVGRYKPDYERLRELKESMQRTGKALNVYQLDMPDGVSNTHRSELEVTIQKIAL